jgi:hypothetical protein
MYYNSLRVINDDFYHHASMTRHLMSRHLLHQKIIIKTLEIIFFQINPSTVEK